MKENITTFVCCVEAGALEYSLQRTIESLRLFGGRLSNSPIIAITPRLGPKLNKKTILFFEKMNVVYYRFRARNEYSWKGFLNKHFALEFAEKKATTDYITWIDNDLLFTDDLGDIIPEHNDFSACVPDSFGATSAPGDEMHDFWEKACNIVGLNLEDLPMVKSHLYNKEIRFYFNSGIFTYKRNTNFAKIHLETTLKFFDARLSSKITGTFFTQYSLGLSVLINHMTWEVLPQEYNYGMGSALINEWKNNPYIREAKVIHYHDSLWPDNWPNFMEMINKYSPDAFSNWLSKKGPLKSQQSFSGKVYGRIIEKLRKKVSNKYNNYCIPI